MVDSLIACKLKEKQTLLKSAVNKAGGRNGRMWWKLSIFVANFWRQFRQLPTPVAYDVAECMCVT